MNSRNSPEKLCAEQILDQPVYETRREITEIATEWADSKKVTWEPICGDTNNRGHVEIVETEIQGLVELLTNSSDAYLVNNTENVDARDELLDSLDGCEKVVVEFTGDGPKRKGSSDSEYSVLVADKGCGVDHNEFEDAFLRDPSIGGIDKRKYEYLYGEFGQGSLASIGISKTGCKFVASASKSNKKQWSWSVTRYNKEKKRYEYLKIDDEIPQFNGNLHISGFGRVSYGTITKVFNINSEGTPKDATENPFIRRLGHAFPKTSVPLEIIDNRDHRMGKMRKWQGMKSELENEDETTKYSKEVELANIGSVNIDIFVVNSDSEFKNEYISSKSSDRIFYTVYGMTHHTETYRKLKNKCGLNGINEDVIVFVECSGLNVPISNIFLPSRTGIKKGEITERFLSQLYNSISNWSTIQEINKQRCDVKDVIDSNGKTPVNELNVVGKENKIVPDINTDNGVGEITIDIDCEEPNYCEYDKVNVDIIGLDCAYEFDIKNNQITLCYNTNKNQTVTVCLRDKIFETEMSQTFRIVVEENKNNEREGNKQSKRVKRGNSFEEKIVNQISDQTEYQVTRESETPDSVIEDATINVSDKQIQPDTDILIHNGSELKAIVSCKRSLRERVGQTAFWKLILADKQIDIPVYLATLDPDNELNKGRKWRTIAEDVLDGVLVLNDNKYEGSNIWSIKSDKSKLNI